jgi:hypothetical protein
VNSHVPRIEDLNLCTRPSLRVLANGPNGRPKWMTADVEAYALINSALHEHFKDLCTSTGNLELYDYMVRRASSYDRVTRKRLRYITTVKDKGNKCRLVAISDFWTQILLEPIMLDCQQYINSSFKTCYSKDHAKGFNMLKKYIRPGIKSYDVSSWTDAFPASLQKVFVRARYGPDIADAWFDLVVNCNWDVKGSKMPIKYNRGQGMGTNGSFDIATATDCLLLNMIYEQDYKMNVTKSTYGKVGDDLWCYDPDNIIHDTYVNDLGIDLNLSKTKFADKNNLVGEFVSRSINHGLDVSRISANICRAVKKNILDLPQLSQHLEERGHESVIPINDYFNSLRINKRLQLNLVRSFYFLTKFYPNHTGMTLLKKSLKETVPDLYYGDEVISFVKSFGMDRLEDSYNIYQIDLILNSIREKISVVFETGPSTGMGAMLDGDFQPSLYWRSEDSVNLMTSKYLLAKSYTIVNGLIMSRFPNKFDLMRSQLEEMDQAITFKELGVISTSGEVWRPRTTQLYKFCKSLVVLDLEKELIKLDYKSVIKNDVSSESSHCLVSLIELPPQDQLSPDNIVFSLW